MKALICYNPKSGSQRVSDNLIYIKTRLKKKYDVVDVYETTGPKSIIEYLKNNSGNYDLVLTSGGDGTLNETVNGILSGGHQTKIAYIPGGTCNDVGAMLRLPKNIKKAMDNVLNGEVVKMDIGKADDKNFVYVFGAGKFINISYQAPSKLKRKIGMFAYYLYGVKEFFTNKKMDLTLEFDGNKISGKYYIIFGLNSDHVSGFHISRKKGVKLNDGLFDLTLIEKKAIAWPKLLGFILFGDHQWLHLGVKTYHISSCKIASNEEIVFNVDGEHAFDKNSCELSMMKQAVNIIVPSKTKVKYF